MDSRVEKALARLQPLVPADRLRAAAGIWDAIAVLLLAEPPLQVEANYLASVAHLPGEQPFLAITGVAEERGKEARECLEDVWCESAQGCENESWFRGKHRLFAPGCAVVPCGRLCVLENQGPCTCVVPRTVASLRRRQRALLWAAEVLMRPICSFCEWAERPGKGCCAAENRRLGLPTSRRELLGLMHRACLAEAKVAERSADRAHLLATAAQVKRDHDSM